MDYLRAHGFMIHRIRMNHPGGAFGYRVVHDDKSFVYMPDNELNPLQPRTSFSELVTFCSGADLLAHDAMYNMDELPAKKGWGHSAVQEACDLAIAAHVRHLVLTHHAPERDDTAIDVLQKKARKQLASHAISCTAAYEGLEFEL